MGAYVLPGAFLVLTFLVYWFAGPQNTIFVNHVNQANSLLHGRLDLVPEFSGFITEPSLYEGKMFLQHGPGPALILLPVVAIFGLETNQTLVSVILAALSAALVYRIVRTQVESVASQVWLTTFFMFGTIFWFVGANGGVWFLSHTATVLFMLLAIYATLEMKNPMLAAAAVGAAFLSRSTVALSFPFFVIMFSDQWLRPADGASLLKRLDLKPIVKMGVGALPFVAFSLAFNYLRFDNPLESGYVYGEQVTQPELAWLYTDGVFDITYIPRHIPVIFEQMPVFLENGPYIRPSWAGQAIWATSPALLLGLFAGVRNRAIAISGAVLLILMATLIVTRALARTWGFAGWGDVDFPLGVHLLPLWGMIGVAIYTGLRTKDRLIIACWAAIIPIMVTIFLFAATGWTQFGYRYALDIYPFLLLLVVKAVGNRIRWYHMTLIVASVVINLWGIVWIYQFEASGYLGLEWVSF